MLITYCLSSNCVSSRAMTLLSAEQPSVFVPNILPSPHTFCSTSALITSFLEAELFYMLLSEKLMCLAQI